LTHRWTAPPPTTPAIQIDIEPAQLGRNHPLRLALLGDARASLADLAEHARASGDPPPRQDWLAHVRSEMDAWRSARDTAWSSETTPLRPERVCREVTTAMPSDAIVVCDTGYAATWAAWFLEVEQPGLRFLRCEGSLGWALPAALGASCARPDVPVVCLTGDGGLWYHLSELETVARLGTRLVVVVLDNSSLAFETHIADEHFAGAGRELTQYRQVDFAALARGFGLTAERVDSASGVAAALGRAFAAEGPTLLDVVIDAASRAPVAGGVHLP
jgi:acetolactate synthase-1/2/3 large subunit